MLTLVARGEFSIVIAGLAVGYATVDAMMTALATTYVLLMAVPSWWYFFISSDSVAAL